MYQFTNVAVFSECFIKYKQTICFGSLPRKNLSNANLSYAVMAETFVNRKKSLRKCEICQKLRIKIPRNFDMIMKTRAQVTAPAISRHSGDLAMHMRKRGACTATEQNGFF